MVQNVSVRIWAGKAPLRMVYGLLKSNSSNQANPCPFLIPYLFPPIAYNTPSPPMGKIKHVGGPGWEGKLYCIGAHFLPPHVIFSFTFACVAFMIVYIFIRLLSATRCNSSLRRIAWPEPFDASRIELVKFNTIDFLDFARASFKIQRKLNV